MLVKNRKRCIFEALLELNVSMSATVENFISEGASLLPANKLERRLTELVRAWETTFETPSDTDASCAGLNDSNACSCDGGSLKCEILARKRKTASMPCAPPILELPEGWPAEES